LKLAGTEYMPRPEGKVLLLEGWSGDPARIRGYFENLRDLGYFDSINGVLLGTFVEMERDGHRPTVEQILIDVLGERKHLPIAKTTQLGHYQDAHCIPIGLAIKL